MQNNRALLDFFDENRQKLFGYLLKMTANREDAEDIFQDTFIKYANAYPHQQSPALLFTVAKSLFLDSVRKHKYTEELNGQDTEGGQNPEEMLISKRESGKIFDLLNKLHTDDRELLALSGSDGLSYEKIAELKKMSVANVKVRIHRARLKLKQMMEQENE